MKFLFILDPLDELKAYKDTSVSMMRAAQARGHRIWVCEPQSLAWRDGAVTAESLEIGVSDRDDDWYEPKEPRRRTLQSCEAVLMRSDPPFDLA